MVSSSTRMALRLAFLLLLLAVALVPETSAGSDPAGGGQYWGLTRFASGDGGLDPPNGGATCDSLVGDCIDEDEEMGMESEVSRRGLAAASRPRYISYAALNKNRVPCNRRGNSYYNCQRHTRANPYRRGCTMITRCQRILD